MGSGKVLSTVMAITALLLILPFIQPAGVVEGQFSVTVDIELYENWINVTVSPTEVRTVSVKGSVTVTKPPSQFVSVDVEIVAEGPANFSVDVEPDTMSFIDAGSEEFTLSVTVPGGLVNMSEASVSVTATASSNAYPSVDDRSTLSIVLEYPPPDTNGTDPQKDPAAGFDPGTHPAVYCGASILFGLLVGGLLYIKRKKAKTMSKEVTYLPHRRWSEKHLKKNGSVSRRARGGKGDGKERWHRKGPMIGTSNEDE